MTRNELREKVARAIYAREYDADHYLLDNEDEVTKRLVYSQADAAIAIVLEEARKSVVKELQFYSCTCSFEAEAAIRALIRDEIKGPYNEGH